MPHATEHPRGSDDGREVVVVLGLGFVGLVLGRALSLALDGSSLWSGSALVGEALSGVLLLMAANRFEAEAAGPAR